MDHDHLHSHTGILTDSSQSGDEEENAHSHLLVNCDDQEEFGGNESDGCRPEEDSTENAVVERLIMIKERHRLSQAAAADVVQLVQAVYNDVSVRVLSAVQNHEREGMSFSYQDLSEIFERLKSPIESVNTAYKQKTYVAKNLPYVVCV